MEKINSVQDLNNVMKIYLSKLLDEDPVFLDHIKLFNDYGYDFITVCDDTVLMGAQEVAVMKDSFEQIRKESPTVTIALVKKYFSEMYGGIYDAEIERALTDGTINLAVPSEAEFEGMIIDEKISELKFDIKELELKSKSFDISKEDKDERDSFISKMIEELRNKISFLEKSKEDLKSSVVTSFLGGRLVNSVIEGTIEDGYNLVHEIRHLLNLPLVSEKRKFLSNISTEGLSFFDGLNYIDYLYGIYPEEDLNVLRKKIVYRVYKNAVEFNWETLLVEIYERHGSVSLDNYVKYCGEEYKDDFEERVVKRGFSSDLSYGNKYIFGINLAFYLLCKVRENPEFISTIISLNEDLHNNPTVTNGQDVPAFFSKIGLDLEADEPFIEYVTSELEYIMSRDEAPGVKL